MGFKRSIRSEKMEKLGDLAKTDSWFRDLLDCWQPAGYPIDESRRFLRLAVRKEYLNFYYKGQSLAKVGFDAKKNPYFETHPKYLGFPDGKNIRLSADGFFKSTTSDEPKKYDGVISIRNRIAGYVSDEKDFVDAIVAANGCVIDLEMGLPAGHEGGSARRIDIVTLEQLEDLQTRLVFWEAKMSNNPELVSRKPEPAIVEQIDRYKAYLSDEENLQLLIEAYENTCSVLVRLHAMTRDIPNLSDVIINVDKGACRISEESVDASVRIVIGCKENKDIGPLHRKKLTDKTKTQRIFFEEGKYIRDDYFLERY